MRTVLAPSAVVALTPDRSSLRFVAPMPGLEPYTRYTLIGNDDSVVFWLECDDAPEIALPLAVAHSVAPDYMIDLSERDAQALDLANSDDAVVLVVLTMADSGSVTANLFAPIVINRATRLARQVILDGTDLPLRYPVGA